MLLGSHLGEITSISTVQRKLKGSSSKISVNCPNSIKLYNSKMGGVDLMDQLKLAYQLDRRLKFRFYLRFNHRPSKRTKAQRPGPIPPLHLPIFLETRRRCTVCSQAGKENRIFVTCSLCDVALCLQKERSCFLQYHL